ncbi:ComEC/Rec2 family competence protein [Mesorhizobium sp. PUT5]|uniref:ComEC/Rec2 family competence protein n=1 Tax=Mesorhizobium sp. PUT5 TaxID=3454629 RepID=UPI003FA438E2
MAGGDRGTDWSGNAAANDVSERDLLGRGPGAAVLFAPVSPPVPNRGPAQEATPSAQEARASFLKAVHGRRSRLSVRRLRAGVAEAAELELDRGAAFLLVPVFLGAGISWYFALPQEPGFLQPVAISLALAVIAFTARSRPRAYLLSMAALMCALGVLAGKLETWRMDTAMLGAEISTSVTGRVVSIDRMASGRVRLTVDVTQTARPKLRYAPERVRLSARKVPDGLRPGMTVSGFARLLPPTGPVRPGGYDYSFQSFFDGIGATGFYLTDPKLLASTDIPARAFMSTAIESARETVAARIRAGIGGPEGEIAAALIVGVRAGIPEEINESMRRTGIYHIISISGLHMALVAGTIMGLLRGAFALFPEYSSRHPVKKYAAFAALVATAAYLLISGMVVAAERSFVMLAVMLVAVLFDRAALTLRNLAISALVVILVSPHEVVGPSFQMSFAATAALVGGFAAWTDYRAGKVRRVRAHGPGRGLAGVVAGWFWKSLLAAAATTIVAGTATTLYAAWHFQRVSPLSLFANLAVMPVVSLVVMPFAVFSALLMPFGLDWPFLYVMGKGLAAMIAISNWLSERSPVDGIGLISLESVLLTTVALVIGTMATTRLRLAAIPFVVLGLLTLRAVQAPDVLVSEDARLVAVPIGGGEIAVNRERPNAFTMENWSRALNAEIAVPPEALKGRDLRYAGEGAPDLPPGSPFMCAARSCVARHPSGAIVVHAANTAAARPACAFAALIVIDDATAADPCSDPLVAVLTKRDLARSGSAAIRFDANSAAAPAEIRFAVENDYRPWHLQRRFSREARGLAPYQANSGPRSRAQGISRTANRNENSSKAPHGSQGDRGRGDDEADDG